MALHPTTETIPRTGRGTGAEETAGDPGFAWPTIEAALAAGRATTWLSLRSEDGVHTRPVFAAWTGTSFVHASNPRAVKTRHLETGAPCALALALDDLRLHLTVEATPRRLVTPADLERARTAFADVYDWPTTVVSDLLDAPYAAPTSGGPPFRAYELTPTRAHAFPTDGQVAPTRFTF